MKSFEQALREAWQTSHSISFDVNEYGVSVTVEAGSVVTTFVVNGDRVLTTIPPAAQDAEGGGR